MKYKAKKHTEEHKFLKLMKRLGIKVDTFTTPDCIYSDALKKGAVVEHSIKRANFAFNKKGKLVGTSDEAVNSFSVRTKK